MRGSHFIKGKFSPMNPKKYHGDVHNIVYRSSWEMALMRWLDDNDFILKWCSEELVIKYISAVDGKMHRYFTDFVAWVQTPQGIKKKIIEVKPHAQTLKPVKRPNEKDQAYAERVRTYMVNLSKWTEARKYASENDAEFVIITEKHIFPANKPMPRMKMVKRPKGYK